MKNNFALCLFGLGALGAVTFAGCSSNMATNTAPIPDMTVVDMATAPAAGSFSISGSVTGLTGTGLVLQLNGTGDIPMNAPGTFTFGSKIATGESYNVTVKTQPSVPSQLCTVTAGAGVMGTSNVTQVAIACITNAIKVGGTVSGLGGTVVLQNNGSDDLTLTTNGSFAFNKALDAGVNFAVTVKTHPANQICTVSGGAGAVTTASSTSVKVTCGTPTTCKDIKAAMPAATDGSYLIDPDGGGALPAITAFCDMTTDGGGYTTYAVTGGISTTRFDQANSCDALGLKLVVARTKAHMTAMMAKYGAGFFQTVSGVYGLAPGNYTGCVMNSGDNACGANWISLDKGTWWARDITYSEPNGDYTPGCWLGLFSTDGNGNLVFNDANCIYATGSSYVCSDNAK